MVKKFHRCLDLCTAVPALVVAAVPILFALTAVRLTMGKGPIYRQERYGLHCKPFTLYKIRSMTNERGPDGLLLPDHQRVTKLGTFIRRYGIDELPQLWNVVKGDMAIFGPRPMNYWHDDPLFVKRHEARPGLLSLASIHHDRSTRLDIAKRWRLDVRQNSSRSFVYDLKILAEIARTILCGKHDPQTRISPEVFYAKHPERLAQLRAGTSIRPRV